MGRKKNGRRGRLRRLAAGLCATAAAIIPGIAAAASTPAPEIIEAGTRTTAPARLLELAGTYPDQVLANRALRRLRAQDPDAHNEIMMAARFARAEIPLARVVSRTDRPTLRLFACDCAARVAPLYERLGCDGTLLERARAEVVAAGMPRSELEPSPAGTPASPTTALEMALAKVERDVALFEQEVAKEAALPRSAVNALGHAIAAPATGPSRRILAVAMAAAEAIDEALLVAAGGSVSRIDTMREAIAEAIYLDHVFRTGDPAGAIDAIFRELAWQRSHLHALRARGLTPARG